MCVQFNEVSKSFTRDFWQKNFIALEKVTFSINAGQITGFLGANGAGKTTSLKILFQLIKATEGNVTFSKELGTSLKTIFSKIGFLPERPYFYPNLTGLEFLVYMGRLANVSNADLQTEIKIWTERLGIAFALDRKLKTYSKGMLQRIGFASCCIHKPQLLILDEPLSGLDPIGRKDFKDIMIELHKEGKTIFFSSHIVSDVEEICQEVVILEKGKLIYSGRLSSFIQNNSKNYYEIKLLKNEDFAQELFGQYISYQSDEFIFLRVPTAEKNNILKMLNQNLDSLYSLIPEKPTLEEVVYKVRNHAK